MSCCGQALFEIQKGLLISLSTMFPIIPLIISQIYIKMGHNKVKCNNQLLIFGQYNKYERVSMILYGEEMKKL